MLLNLADDNVIKENALCVESLVQVVAKPRSLCTSYQGRFNPVERLRLA
jgi:hypothetical protein